jgi:methionyl-tRNA formyltransferase
MDVYHWLCRREYVFLYGGKLMPGMVEELRPSLIVSYSYKHIISGDVIAMMPQKIINLHISLLPWNRGASPNFFSFFENTPKGVSIHLIDEGIDTGDVLCQKEIVFHEEEETFASSYTKLHHAVQSLLFSCWDDIRQGRMMPQKQPPGGSFHTVAGFENIKKTFPFEWGENIAAFKEKYRIEADL